MSDETLEREIEAALGVDPSPEFLPRIRSRVASEPVRSAWWTSVSWRWTATVAVIALAVVGVWLVRDPSRALIESQMANAPDVVPSRPAPLVALPLSVAPAVVPVVRAARSARRQAVSAPLVLISPDEVVALRKLMVAIAARQVEAVDIPNLGGESAPLPPIEEIVLDPIELSPIAGLEGE